MQHRIISNFKNCHTGNLKESDLNKLFEINGCRFLVGKFTRIKLHFNNKVRNLSIIKFHGSKAIQLSLEKFKFGPFPGCNWKIPLNQKSDVAQISYNIYLPNEFDYVKGGKLPGLGGGDGNTGGEIPTGDDGWSVRFMFKEGGIICAYLYYPEMQTKFGEKRFLTDNNEPLILKKGEWNNIRLHIEMNLPENDNGIVRCWLNGVQGLEIDNLIFRRTKDLGIDHLLFSSFMGGGDTSYAPKQHQFLLFKDFEITYL